jgi:hypothetical protein
VVLVGGAGCAGRGGAATGGPARAAGACRAPLPGAELAVPPGNALAAELAAEGVQVYACTASAAGVAWVFTAPEATLRDPAGAPAGRHFAGPTWEALDGSRVVGAKVAAATPEPAAIPWLLLRAASHAGDGALARITFVQRIATRGGLAPADGCSAATVGAVARVPYAATYCLYAPE